MDQGYKQKDGISPLSKVVSLTLDRMICFYFCYLEHVWTKVINKQKDGISPPSKVFYHYLYM